MSRADDLFNAVQKTVGDTPLYLLAGAGDLVAEKLRELPEVLNNFQRDQREVPLRAAGNIIGAAFRANLKLGEFYDDLTRRGQDVVAKMRGDEVVDEDDEPFVREPFMPKPVRPASSTTAAYAAKPPAATAAEKAPAKKAAKKAPAKKAAKKAPGKKAAKKVSKEAPAEPTGAGDALGTES